MSTDLKTSPSNGHEKIFTSEEQQEKIRRLVGPLSDKSSIYCSDATIARYLRARNWNVKKATKMMKETLKSRMEYKPEEIHWEEVSHEAETGKIYQSNYIDKYGRTVLAMRPSCQSNTAELQRIIKPQLPIEYVIQIKTAEDSFQGIKAYTINYMKPLNEEQEEATSLELTASFPSTQETPEASTSGASLPQS